MVRLGGNKTNMALHRHRDWVRVRAIDLALLVELKTARKRCVGAEIFTTDLMTYGTRDAIFTESSFRMAITQECKHLTLGTRANWGCHGRVTSAADLLNMRFLGWSCRDLRRNGRFPIWVNGRVRHHRTRPKIERSNVAVLSISHRRSCI